MGEAVLNGHVRNRERVERCVLWSIYILCMYVCFWMC